MKGIVKMNRMKKWLGILIPLVIIIAFHLYVAIAGATENDTIPLFFIRLTIAPAFLFFVGLIAFAFVGPQITHLLALLMLVVYVLAWVCLIGMFIKLIKGRRKNES
jgi:hypothetical protein